MCKALQLALHKVDLGLIRLALDMISWSLPVVIIECIDRNKPWGLWHVVPKQIQDIQYLPFVEKEKRRLNILLQKWDHLLFGEPSLLQSHILFSEPLISHVYIKNRFQDLVRSLAQHHQRFIISRDWEHLTLSRKRFLWSTLKQNN